MNKIEIANDKIVSVDINEKIDIHLEEKNGDFEVNNLTINVLDNETQELEIVYNSDTLTKLNIFIKLGCNSFLKLYEKRIGSEHKIQYKYYLKNNSKIVVNKFHNVSNMRELDIINLNGENASFEYNFSSIATNLEKYDLMIYHNYPKTESKINNHGVSIENGEIKFNITGIVLSGKKGCSVSQNSRIIVLNDKTNEVKPNLLIEENDVSAYHSALIGNFNEEELFYMQSKGLNNNQCFNLLIKGLLVGSLGISELHKKELLEIINRYWG